MGGMKNSVLTGCKTNNGLTLFYTNAGSLLNKLDELKMSISLYNPDIICICETHFSQEIDECEVALEGYCIFRADRGFKTKGKTELLTGTYLLDLWRLQGPRVNSSPPQASISH